MRRLIVEDPMSRPATLSLWLGRLALAVFLIAALLTRFEGVELEAGLAALAAACALAGLATLLAIAAFVRIWNEGHKGFGRAVGGLLLAVLVLAYPAVLAIGATTGPPMLDVVTDGQDPPSFSASRGAMQARDGWRPRPVPAGLRTSQRAAAPRLAGLDLALPEDAAFALAREAADARGFAVLDASAPGGRSQGGRIDASARTLVLRLPIELAIRVRPTREGARVDVRAVTRAPIADIGGPRAAMEAYLGEIEARASRL